MMCTIVLLGYDIAEAKKKPISLEEAIHMALKNNLNIQMADNTKKQAILSTKIDHFRLWAPQVTLKTNQINTWQSKYSIHTIESRPIFSVEWQLTSLFDKILQAKIDGQNNALYILVAKKSVENELQKVVYAYYALALAQKKWALSNNLIKLATTRLNTEEEKLRVGLISQIDCLDAQLALKKVKLTLLERQEALKEKRRSLNIMVGKPINEVTWVQSNISIDPIWDIKAVRKEKLVDLDTAIQAKKVAIAATHLSRAKAYPLACLNLFSSFRSNGYLYDLKDKRWSVDNNPSKWSGGIGISIDIATLLLLPATVKKAKIALDNEKFALTQKKLAIEGGLEDKKSQYHHALHAYKVVAAQLKISKQKLTFVREKYRLNRLKLLELHEAEEDTQKIEIDLIEQAFKVKQAEFDLYRMVGMLHQ
ncbi:TolC family protein [Candidatus Cardinium hertigii]|uniref:TolC family protein n=1 Tax=Candidatus Cardinium hertigii TaxID=247481 RepID=UPI003D7ED85C